MHPATTLLSTINTHSRNRALCLASVRSSRNTPHSRAPPIASRTGSQAQGSESNVKTFCAMTERPSMLNVASTRTGPPLGLVERSRNGLLEEDPAGMVRNTEPPSAPAPARSLCSETSASCVETSIRSEEHTSELQSLRHL